MSTGFNLPPRLTVMSARCAPLSRRIRATCPAPHACDRRRAFDRDLAVRRGGGDGKRPGFNPVGNDFVFHTVKLIDASNRKSSDCPRRKFWRPSR